MALVKDINTKDWSISSTQLNEVAIGFNDLKQCVMNILMTVPGSDPLRPEFGCDIFRYLDKPVNRVLPLMMKSITDAIEIYEPRVTITKITAIVENPSLITFEILMDAVLGNFGFKVNFGRDPFSADDGKYVVTEDGFFWVDENGNRVVYG